VRKTLTLALRDKPERLRYTFAPKRVGVEVLAEPGPRRITASYEAFEMAPGIFFVSYLASTTGSVAMALDLVRGVATLVTGALTPAGIVSTVESARVEEVRGDGDVAAPYHLPFNLGGTRLLNTYAHNVAYEHIYLTGAYETWLGVRGPEVGQADTEEYRAFKIAEGVYLVCWNEKILTTQMTFLFNFFAGNCVGEVFGRLEGKIVHNTIGANARLIHTKLPELPTVTRLDVYSGGE
jgi:hypothetical protein